MRLTIQDNPELVMKAHAFLDGVDVSSDAFGADEELGEVYLYRRNEEGRIYKIHASGVCKGEAEPFGCNCPLATDIKYGKVRIEIGS